VFNQSCRIFSPIYRQATIYAFLLSRSSGRAALDFAFRDVKRAFANFLHRIGGTRPFVLAGHSQGSHHLLRLLVETVDADPALAQRLVCAYLVGVRVRFMRHGTRLLHAAWHVCAACFHTLGAS
jgi:predicted alpha/beta-fold hydrolase